MTSHISEPARQTPVLAAAEVVVVGSGPGGLAAAIAAAQSDSHAVMGKIIIDGTGHAAVRNMMCCTVAGQEARIA